MIKVIFLRLLIASVGALVSLLRDGDEFAVGAVMHLSGAASSTSVSTCSQIRVNMRRRAATFSTPSPNNRDIRRFSQPWK